MWVRSQDRETLAQVDYFDLSEDADGKIEIVVFSKNGLIDTMGIYKTKERALEVLDEIQETIIRTDSVITVSGDALEQNTVYNMPKE